MCTAARKRIAVATKRSWRHATCFISVLTGIGSGVALYYYNHRYYPCAQRKSALEMQLRPVRKTQQYIAGTPSGSGLLAEVSTMHRVAFFFYSIHRMGLLFVRIVPVVWYAVLTYVFHTCSESYFHDQVVAFLSSMGPSYIKLGQWMATRPDFFPPQFCVALEKLFDRTEAHGWSHTEKLLRRKITDGPLKGTNALHYISEIEKIPVNSGSVAQIHRAKLRDELDGIPAGTELAVKVTHPFIQEQIAADLSAMRMFVALMDWAVPGFENFNLSSSVLEFSSLIRSQLNLLIECDNLQQFRYNFRDFDGVVIPSPLPSLCTENVLFETFEEGEPLQNVHSSLDNEDIAALGCHMFLKMLFEDNFVHSDLHPGNVLLRTNPSTSTREYYPSGKQKLDRELVLLDAGLVTTLSHEERHNFVSLFAAVACGDGELGANLMLERLPNHMRCEKEPNKDRFLASMKDIFDLVAPGTSGFTLRDIHIGTILGKIMSAVRQSNTSLDGNFASLVLAVIVGEGLGRKLTPDFNIFAESAPYLIAFLEDEELFSIADKLRRTYGTAAVLRDSMGLVRPHRTMTYVELAGKKGANIMHKMWPAGQ